MAEPTIPRISVPAIPQDKGICFVVMPFGVKPLNDGTNRTFNFDKVYKVVIQRAVLAAGLTPLRADEQVGAAIIHWEMFKQLRDAPIVLADLSTGNPNVFYELGIRHVMSPTGTVLICRQGSELPFDVKLSRVVFYEYDGNSFDYEEAERVVPLLTKALKEAKGRQPDSPVHALLEPVFPSCASSRTQGSTANPNSNNSGPRLDKYQEMLAASWRDEDLQKLREQHGFNEFGLRVVGHYCLRKRRGPLPPEADSIAADLYHLEQYDLANRLFARLKTEKRLGVDALLCYGSSLSEEDKSVKGADAGLRYARQALKSLSSKGKASDDQAESAAHCHSNIAGLHFWKWILTEDPNQLLSAVEEQKKAIGYATRVQTTLSKIGRLAQCHLKLLFMLRKCENDVRRPDVEGHAEAILDITPSDRWHVREISYLQWYQAIALADMGQQQRAEELKDHRLLEDGKIMNHAGCMEIGHRQYAHLRRFIEQYSSMMQEPALVGRITQRLQSL